MSGSDRLRVERFGGLGGFGLPGAHVRSVGELEYASLDATTRQAVDRLFAGGAAAQPGAAGAALRDGFRYRIMRGDAAAQRSVVVAEAQVPEELRACVRDQLV